ncbi:GNAT family N-acetyltransferase [Candidatus Promineifilum breve]|nr:GNAT family N-acetyltransferase [Candidatus Promineifilum breve]
MHLGSQFDIRAAVPDDAASLFVVQAALAPTDAGQMPVWMQEMEERLESGGRAWVAARGRRLAGYALIDPLPGLPGDYDLSGGIVPARRRQGLGTRLLRHVQDAGRELGVGRLSCRVESLEDETATFLLRRGFSIEHEECLLELGDLTDLPPVPTGPPAELTTLEPEQAVATFCRVYDAAFAGQPWSQPYTALEVAGALTDPDDLLFLMAGGEAIGVVWHEMLPNGRGRIEPIGIAPDYQGRGYGRRLLIEALHRLRRRGANPIEIGLWRRNDVAMNLYKSLGFSEEQNWYYLACDLAGLKTV